MAKVGINTGSAPNAGDGSTLLAGANAINSNFTEVYDLLGDGTNLPAGIVTSIVAGTNVTISGATGAVTINASGGSSYTNSDVDTHLNTGTATSGQILSWNGSDYDWVADQTGGGGGGSIAGINTTGTSFFNQIDASQINVSGITTLSDDVTFLGQGQNLLWDNTDNILWFKTNSVGGQSAKIWLGDGNSFGNLEIYRSVAGYNLIESRNSDLQIGAYGAAGKVKLLSGDEVSIINSSQAAGYWIRCKENTNISDQYVNLYYGYTGTEANDIRLSTTAGGISVNGHVGASGSITAATFYGNGAGLTGVSGGTLASRTTKSATTASLNAAASGDLSITAFKAYNLLKIGIDYPAWVRLYVDAASRTSDASRAEGTDPTPGSGVIAEVLTSSAGASTFLMSPGVFGWNNDGTPATTVYARVTNKDSSARAITVTLTLIQAEA